MTKVSIFCHVEKNVCNSCFLFQNLEHVLRVPFCAAGRESIAQSLSPRHREGSKKFESLLQSRSLSRSGSSASVKTHGSIARSNSRKSNWLVGSPSGGIDDGIFSVKLFLFVLLCDL